MGYTIYEEIKATKRVTAEIFKEIKINDKRGCLKKDQDAGIVDSVNNGAEFLLASVDELYN